MIAPAQPPASTFRLLRYFGVASLAVFLPVAATLIYFDFEEDEVFKQVQQEQNLLFAQMQERLVQRHDMAVPAYLLSVYENGNLNLTQLFAKALWEKDFAPLMEKTQLIPIDQCRAIAEIKDASGKSLQPLAKQDCYAGIGRQIMALPEFQALDAKLFGLAKNSTVIKIKLFDVRGITVYSSEHKQIGEDKIGTAGWENALAGKLASELTSRDKFSAFEGEVANRDVISTYVPLRAAGSERIVAVFEVYSDATPFIERIKSTSSEIWNVTAANRTQMERLATANQAKVDAAASLMTAIVVGLLALFYGALFAIVRNGQRIIDKQDIQRKQAGLALSRQKDLYHVLSQSNKAIVHLVDRDALFAEVCRVAVEHGRFRFAWIGLIGQSDSRLKPVARYGENAGYIDALDISGDAASDTRRGLTGRTLLSGSHVISNDFLNDPAMAPWHEAARRAGVRASAKFPIREGGAVIGAISLYAGETGFFTQELVATIDEIAIDVSFALDNYAREAARRKAEQALREGEERYRQMFHTNPHPMWVYDEETLAFLAVNDAAIERYGWSREEFLAMTITDLRPVEDRPALLKQLASENETKLKNDNVKLRKKDGTPIDVEITSHTIDFGGRHARIESAHDITERKRAEESLRAAEEQFRGLVEQSIAGIYIIQDGVLAYVNPRFAEIMGYDCAAELTGSNALLLVAKNERVAVNEKIREWLRGTTHSIGYGTSVVRKDGSSVEVGVHAARASHRGRPAIIGLLQDISEKKRAEEQIQHYVDQLEKAFMRTVEVATTLSEMRDPYTAGHERRVAEIAVAIGTELGFDARRAEGLRVAGYLHDIGKITIPSEILSKPGRLNAAEFMLIKGHAQASYDILKNVEFPWPVAEIALQHHERIDGSGYPQGLRGEAIQLEARILAVADVVEAMSSHRPYRPGLGLEKALAEIERGRGIQYDANVADACLKLFREKGYAIAA